VSPLTIWLPGRTLWASLSTESLPGIKTHFLGSAFKQWHGMEEKSFPAHFIHRCSFLFLFQIQLVKQFKVGYWIRG
jgi:hypothetical protein